MHRKGAEVGLRGSGECSLASRGLPFPYTDTTCPSTSRQVTSSSVRRRGRRELGLLFLRMDWFFGSRSQALVH